MENIFEQLLNTSLDSSLKTTESLDAIKINILETCNDKKELNKFKKTLLSGIKSNEKNLKKASKLKTKDDRIIKLIKKFNNEIEYDNIILAKIEEKLNAIQ